MICAKKAGIPEEILQRAQHISVKLRNNESVEPLNNDKNLKKEKRYIEVLKRFNNLDCDSNDQMQHFIQFLKAQDVEEEPIDESEKLDGMESEIDDTPSS